MPKKSILINEFHHKELVKISKTFGANYGNLIQSMILYFKKTGINPTEAINENPAAMVKALDKRIISFIKTQERDILKPIRIENFESSNALKEQNGELKKLLNSNIKWIKDVVVKINDFDKHRTEKSINEIKNLQLVLESQLNVFQSKYTNQQKAILLIAELIDDKNKAGIQNKIKSLFK